MAVNHRFAALLIAVCLLSTAGCSKGVAVESVAGDETVVVERTSHPAAEPPQASADDENRGRSGGREGMGQMGQVASVSDGEIAVYPAEMDVPQGGPGSRGGGEGPPERDGERPERDGTPPDMAGNPPELPDGEDPDGERPGGREMRYADQATAYTLADGVTVTRGMGDGAETAALSDIAEGDQVRLVLDDSGAVASIVLIRSELEK